MTEATVSIEDLEKIDKKYSDGWSAFDKMKTLTRGAPEGTLGRLLWEAYGDGKIGLAKFHNNLRDLVSVGEAYDGPMVFRLLEELVAFDNERGYAMSYSSFDLPGSPEFLFRALEAKEGDPSFGEYLASRWEELPEPYASGLAAVLAKKGHLPVESLRDGLARELAVAFLEDSSARHWQDRIPFVGKEWAEILVAAVQSDDVDWVGTDEHVRVVREHVSPTELVSFLGKVDLGYDHRLPIVEEVAPAFVDHLEKVEEAILKLPEAEPDPYNPKVPAFVPLVCYYRACQLADEVPSEELDEALRETLAAYRPRWSGSNFDQHHQRLHEILKAVPEDRLEEALLSAENVPWLLIGAAPTRKVCERVAAGLAEMDKINVPHNFESHRSLALASGGADMAKALSEVLKPGKGWQREPLTAALGMLKDPVAAPCLVGMLADSTKGVTEAAKAGLIALPPEVVLEHLEDALGAGKKGTRLAAAEVLQALPPSLKAWELAQEALESEKTADVKEILASVPKGEAGGGPTVDAGLKDEIRAALEADSEAWTKYVEEPEAAMEAAIEVFGAQSAERALAYGHGLWRNFVPVLLEAGADSAHQHRLVTKILGGFYPAAAEKLLDDCVRVVPSFADSVAVAFIQGRISRPPEFGAPPRWGDAFEGKDALQWLIANAPEAARPACLAGLQDSSKVIRDMSVEFLTQDPGQLDVDADVLPLLEARTKDSREAAVKLLAALGDPSYLPVLKKAAEKERSKGVKELIQDTLVALEVQDLDLGSFADDAEGNAGLVEALAGLPEAGLPGPVEEGFDDLPGISFRNGGTLQGSALRWFLSEIFGSGDEKAQLVRDRLVDEECHHLCDVLIELNGGRDDLGWALQMQGYLAGPEQVESLGRRLEDFASSQMYGWGDFAVNALVKLGTNQAARILDDWAQRTRKNALKKRAGSGVYRIAEARGISRAELMEQAVGTLGFDEDGTQRFDYGARTIVVRLSPSGDELLYEDEEGASFKSMPQARKADDDALAAAARSRVSQIKKDLRRVRRAQTRGLQGSMTSGRRWIPSVWRERYVEHPLMRSFGFGLVWGIYDGEGQLVDAFQLDDDAVAVNLDFEEPEISEEVHRIGIAHPLELGDDVEAWLTTLADYERVQPFEQLQRPVYSREEFPDVSKFLARRVGVEAGRFLGALNRLGYDLGPREDAGAIYFSQRYVGDVAISVNHGGFAPEWLDGAGLVDVDSVSVTLDGTSKALKDLSDVIYSEILHDLHELTDGD